MGDFNMIRSYLPELGEPKPANTVGDVRYGGPGHYTLKTPLELKGRGIKNVATLKPDDLTDAAQGKAGWHQYWVSELAMATLEKQYDFAREALLD